MEDHRIHKLFPTYTYGQTGAGDKSNVITLIPEGINNKAA